MERFFKNKIIKIIIVIFAIIGVIHSILFLNYILNDNFKLSLSQKTRNDAWLSMEKKYNKKYDQNKTFGEFCYRFTGNERDENKIKLSQDKQKIRGTVYTSGSSYKAEIDPQTLKLEIENISK